MLGVAWQHTQRPTAAVSEDAPSPVRRSRAASPRGLRPSVDWSTRHSALPLPATAATALARPGRPLTADERASTPMVADVDLGRVRILDGGEAARAADDLDADAFAFGNKIGFAAGRYRPGSPSTEALLRHELVHVAQQRGVTGPPRGVASPDSSAELAAQGRAPAGADSVAGELVHRQPRGTPEQKPPERDRPKAASDLRTRVRAWLNSEHFDVPLVVDMEPPFHAVYSDQRWTLDHITDDTYDVLHQTDHSVKRSDVWMQVWQYYQEKVAAIEETSWNTSIQLLWTPTYTLASNQPLDSRLSNPLQLSAGLTYQAHKQGFGGFEHQLALTGSFFDLGSGKVDWFQNALLQYQASAVTPLGRDFRLLGGPWASAQASLYAQLAVGVGATWAARPGADRRAYLGFLAQPGAGGQILVTVGHFSLVVNGTVVYSYLGTPGANLPPDVHHQTQTLGFQGGLGFQGQF